MLSALDFINLGRIGEGQFGCVDAVRCRVDDQVYAMKSIRKLSAARYHLDLFLERDIHRASDRYAPSLIASFQTHSDLHLVTEYAACGSLWDRIACGELSSTITLDSKETRWWTAQIIDAIKWIHSIGYVHRDIKPHNCLLFPDKRLKLTDFGSAARSISGVVDPAACALPVGTPDYIAPEILEHAEISSRRCGSLPYTNSVDWWSLGVTVYELIVGRPPFYSDAINETYRRIKLVDYVHPTAPNDLQALISDTLCLPSQRRPPSISAAACPAPLSLAYIQPEIPDCHAPNQTFDMTSITAVTTMISAGGPDPWLEWPYCINLATRPPPCTPPRPKRYKEIPHSTVRRRAIPETAAYEQLLMCVAAVGITPTQSISVLEEWLDRSQQRLEVSNA